MKKTMKRIFIGAIALILVVEGFSPSTTKAVTTTSKVSVGNYVKELVKVSGIAVNEAESNAYVKAATENGIIKEGEYTSYSVSITNEQAAVLAERTDEKLHGTDFNGDLVSEITKKKRIADLSKADPSMKTEIVKVFSKGIMVGESRGNYTHSRVFNPKGTLTSKEANVIYTRLATSSKRMKLSPDGQIIRTTNLPTNYKYFNYILESFPNAFYEKKFGYQLSKYYYKPVEFKDYANPARLKNKSFNGYKMQDVLDANLDTWAKKVQTNLQTRLNVDYRTIDNDWVNRLRSTYYIYGDATSDKRKTDYIKEYVAKVKKNKVIVKGTVSVEPSVLYYDLGYYMRAYIRFKVDNATNMNVEEDLIYGKVVYLPNLEKDKWISMYVDIELGSANGYSNGEDYAVFSDGIF